LHLTELRDEVHHPTERLDGIAAICRLWGKSRHRFDIRGCLLFDPKRMQRVRCKMSALEGPVAQGRAVSKGCTFAPPAIKGFDGSMRSCSSRFRTSARATTKASFRLLACRSATLKKASPK